MNICTNLQTGKRNKPIISVLITIKNNIIYNTACKSFITIYSTRYGSSGGEVNIFFLVDAWVEVQFVVHFDKVGGR